MGEALTPFLGKQEDLSEVPVHQDMQHREHTGGITRSVCSCTAMV